MLTPLRLTVTDRPAPSVVITSPTGATFDATPHLTWLGVDLDPQRGTLVTLTLSATVEFDFPVQTVAVTGDPLDGLTAAEIDQVIARGGMASTPGELVVAHLRART
jgi:hypothetical protein